VEGEMASVSILPYCHYKKVFEKSAILLRYVIGRPYVHLHAVSCRMCHRPNARYYELQPVYSGTHQFQL